MEDSLKEMQQGGFLPDVSESTNRSVHVRTRRPCGCCHTAPGDDQPPTATSTIGQCRVEHESRCSTLEEIQGEGQRPPLFCMPAADGLTLVYHELADRLGPNQPVYGLNSPGAIGEEVPDSFEEMATRFVADIREIRPHGPYCLIGYCSGGSVAFEVAQQLVAAGEQVAFVCGIETYDWSTSPAARLSVWVKMDYEFERLYYHGRNFLSLGLHDKRSFVRSKLDRLKSRLRVWKGMFAGLLRRKKPQRRGPIDWNELWRRHDEISVRYFPKPYPGKLLLIRPKKDYRTYIGKEDLQALGGVRIVRLSAFPACLMTPPYVDQVARLIEASIDEGLQECGRVESTAMHREADPTKADNTAECGVEM